MFDQHRAVKNWLEDELSMGVETLGLTWQAAASFLRIGTNRRVFEKPCDLDFAIKCLEDLYSHPGVSEVGPTKNHWVTYSTILREQNLVGDDVMDARITAIAVEHKAAIATVDKGFRRFLDYVRIVDPTANKEGKKK